jgi:glycosyltransferase involved in cell wall biosynthesis
VNDVTFSVIVPTRGRKTILPALESITEQFEPGDEVIVRCSRDEDFGNSARQSMIERAKGTHLLFMDDDDQFARGALATMRAFAREHPGRIGIFKMRHPAGTTHWGEPVLRYANVSTQTFLVPNVPGKLGRWHRDVERPGGGHYIGDYAFITETVRLQGDPVFVDEVTVYVRPVDPLRRLLIRARYLAALRTRARRLLGAARESA